MPDRDIPFGKLLQMPVRKDFGDQSHPLVILDLVRIGNGDTAALLPSVLQSIQTVIDGVRNVARFVAVYAEHAALFMHAVERKFSVT